ncbi:substrate-binding domain-containing protein [uncultured Pseudomonas sp.]|uniref:substrate-binding domain-containing protein n=1 Tax=uncultured Pseudomonas sp. TaxID=114707 RepID=UPI0025E81FC1|nr:substrate-binding domain-containing protein [uncultured Pseudomonas sp.]
MTPIRFRSLLVALLAGTWLVPTLGATPLIGIASAKSDNFQNLLRSSMEQHASQLGADTFVMDANNDPVLQQRQVRNLIAAKVDALIVVPSVIRAAPDLLREATTAGIPIVLLNRQYLPEQWPAKAAYVGSNELESGTLQMEELARRAHYQGKVAILVGDPDNPSSRMRTEDVEKVVAKYPEMQVVQKTTANWERNQATDAVTDWLKKGVAFDIIAANNDEMALGAIRALEKAGKNSKDTLIGGIDATPEALQELRSGKLAVTVLQDAKGQGGTAIDVALAMAQGQPVAEHVSWIPFRLMTSDSLEQSQ